MFWYAYMAAAEDVQTQRNGLIAIIFAVGDSIRRRLDSAAYLRLSKLLNAIPYLVRGVHFCYEDEVVAHIYPNPIKIIQLAVDTFTRAKFRVHHGTFFKKQANKKREIVYNCFLLQRREKREQTNQRLLPFARPCLFASDGGISLIR